MATANLRTYEPLADLVRASPFLDLVQPHRLSRVAGCSVGAAGRARDQDEREGGLRRLSREAEIPGVKKEDIRIVVEGNTVSITAEVRREKETGTEANRPLQRTRTKARSHAALRCRSTSTTPRRRRSTRTGSWNSPCRKKPAAAPGRCRSASAEFRGRARNRPRRGSRMSRLRRRSACHESESQNAKRRRIMPLDAQAVGCRSEFPSGQPRRPIGRGSTACRSCRWRPRVPRQPGRTRTAAAIRRARPLRDHGPGPRDACALRRRRLCGLCRRGAANAGAGGRSCEPRGRGRRGVMIAGRRRTRRNVRRPIEA